MLLIRDPRTRLEMCGLLICVSLVATAQADLYVSAASANSVMRFDEDGTFLGNFVTPQAGGLGDPQGIAFGPNGNLFVASHGSRNVLEFDGSTGDFVKVFASHPDWLWPAEINFRDGLLYVSDFRGGGTVTRFDAHTGEFVDVFISALSRPDGQTWDDDGNIYISEFGRNKVSKFDGQSGAPLGDFIPSIGGQLRGPLDNLFLPDGSFLVSSFNNNRVKHYDDTGAFIGDIATLSGPQGLEIGPRGQLHAGSFTNGIINRYDIDSFALLGTAASTMGTSTTNNFTFDVVPEPAFGLCSVCLCLLFAERRTRRRSSERRLKSLTSPS